MNHVGLNTVILNISSPKSLLDRILKVLNGSLIANAISPNGDSWMFLFRGTPMPFTNADEEVCYPITVACDYYESDTSRVRSYKENHLGDPIIDDEESNEDTINYLKRMILETRPPCELTDILLEICSLAPVSENDKRPMKTFIPPRKRPMRDLDPNENKRWTPSRVTLIGDSAHTCTQYLGIGTNIAMQDADDLCKSLMNLDKDGWKICLEHYERKMKQRGSFWVKLSRFDALSEHIIFKTRFGWWAYKCFLKTFMILAKFFYWCLF